MNSSSKKDQLYPMREELRNRGHSEHVAEKTKVTITDNSHSKSVIPANTTSRNAQLQASPEKYNKSKERSDAFDDLRQYQQNERLAQVQEAEKKQRLWEFEQRQEDDRKEKQRNAEWQRRRREDPAEEDFMATMANYKAKQKQQDQEREAFNKKYSDRNKEIAADLKRQNLEHASTDKQHKKTEASSKKNPDQDKNIETGHKQKNLDQKSKKRPRENEISTPTSSPIKAPPRQRLKTAIPARQILERSAPFVELQNVNPEEADLEESMLNVSICDNLSLEVSNGELIEQMSTSGLKYKNPLQKNFLKEYIFKKFQITEDDLSRSELAEVQKSISKFLTTFHKKFSDSKVSYTMSKLISDRWCSAQLNLPESVVNRLTINSFTEDPMEPIKENVTFFHEELCTVMKNNLNCDFTDTQKQVQAIKSYILRKLSLEEKDIMDCNEELEEKIMNFVKSICKKYQKGNRIYNRLIQSLAKNSKDESKQFYLPESITNHLQDHSPSKSTEVKKNAPKAFEEVITYAQHHKDQDSPMTTQNVPFIEKSKRAQQYACRNLRENFDPQLIVATAAQVVNPACGRLIRKANSSTGLTAQDAIKENKKELIEVGRYSADESLAYILNHSLTKQSYLDMKAASTSKGANIWPDYNQVLEAKKKCRPEGIEVSELEASVPMQNLLDHTGKRIFSDDPELTETLKLLATKNGGELNVTLYFKYGMDGCGSFSSFMQKDSTGELQDLSSLLTCQMVPLQAVAFSEGKKIVVYNSKFPNNANSCRPLRICFEKENKETIAREADRLQGEVTNLKDFVLIEDPKVTVSYKGLFTMIDGKVLNVLTNNPSSSNCPICHKTSRQMASNSGDSTPKEGCLHYGISPLHFGIRSFELIYKIGYRQNTKKFGQKFSEEEKNTNKACEEKVKQLFQEKLGIRIDQRRDGGAGNTSTGNVARTALANPDITAEICGVSPDLVKNIQVIWGTLASGFAIDSNKFDQLCKETLSLYQVSVC